MFYWSHRDIHIVLSDEEEMQLVQELGKTPKERIGYNLFLQDRKAIEQRIFKYLKKSLDADPDSFNRRFVFRSCHGIDAQKMFPIMLEAYGRVTRRATIGQWGEPSLIEQAVDNVIYGDEEDVYNISLFERPRFPWSSPSVSGYISLPKSSIEKLGGTVNNFFVSSEAVTLKFHRDFIRISVFETKNESDQDSIIDD